MQKMHQDVLALIRRYAHEMTVLESLLREFRAKFHYLEAVRFETLDDMVKFTCFANMRLNGVHVMQFLGLSACQCHCHRDCFLYIYTESIFTSNPMTMGNVFRFIEESEMVCEHEKVTGFVVSGETIYILMKRTPVEVNERARETTAPAETPSEG